MSEKLEWYVVHTYSGYENKVAQNIEKVVDNRGLRDLIAEVRIPTERVTELRETKSKKEGTKMVEVEVERKLFPSYVFVKMVLTDDTWYIVRNTRGATGFVGPGSKPVPLTDKEVEELGVENDHTVVEVSFDVGDYVTVVGGSFDGLSGIVKSINTEDHTAELVISMFGRETPVTLPFVQVKSEK